MWFEAPRALYVGWGLSLVDPAAWKMWVTTELGFPGPGGLSTEKLGESGYKLGLDRYNVRPPSYKLVYKPQ